MGNPAPGAAQLSRRDALRAWLGAAAAVAPAAAVAGGYPHAPGGESDRRGALPQPRVLRSANGALAVTLTAVPGVVEMGAPQPVRTYTYDGVVPGHTWEVFPGDQLSVELVNALPALPHGEMLPSDRPHEWTTTNLHTHGLHVSPAGDGDNIFLSVPPGGRQRYHYAIPPDHPSGIFWYHPHRHGAVAQQVRAGMAGMIVVRGDLDRVPEVAAARERVLVLQSIELGDDFRLLDPIPLPTTEQAFYPRTRVLYTVNGVLAPRIRMYPGEVQRWRILNAAEGKFMSLRLAGHGLHVLAWDGLTLPAPEPTEVLMVSAGNRVEVLVKAGAPGVYDLVLTPGSSQKPDIPGMPGTPEAGMPAMEEPAHAPGLPLIPGELETRPIATLEVVGSGRAMPLPAALPAWNPLAPPVARRRTLAFTVSRAPDNEFLSFGVDGRTFDPERAPYQARLDTTEEWTLVNAPDSRLAEHAHVFHIHVNPFKVTRINGTPLAKPLWRDTFVLTKSDGDSFTFETTFRDFTGRFVEHCHVLSHEDLGMMSAVEVVP